MAEKRDTLATVQAIAVIVSAVAVPVILAVIGWVVQANIATQSTKKDYVSMAVHVLTDSKSDKNSDLRKWAVAVLDKTSPVPFSENLRAKLESGAIVITQPVVIAKPVFPNPPAEFMEPPQKPLPLSGIRTNGDLLNNAVENYYRLKINAINQEYLQQWIRDTSKIINTEPHMFKSKPTSDKSDHT